ncbi:NUDIX hydrolase [Lewinella sp. 4G2]|uniref:NUDIX hydrolase n=1 Tax=Lewinella sp. 4G2 TaxID=1803372 RepID=UPI0007B4C985|nr:NUDIX domain-containing protein [Lewinella sp. 4G2]OAV43053.1 hypothetical protein A3850_000415 [Lewinella sp. 4G2]
MYVIYINDRPLRLLAKPFSKSDEAPAGTHLTARYNGKARTLLNYVDMLEKGSPKVLSVDIVHSDLEQLWSHFRSHFEWVPAAGGIVQLKGTEKVLFILRRGFWDLPKGKIDPGESNAQAAVREVEEETGLREITLGQALQTTYHTYRKKKGARVLKPTYWFAMQAGQQDLTPQVEEDIERAEWIRPEDVLGDGLPIYRSLAAIL